MITPCTQPQRALAHGSVALLPMAAPPPPSTHSSVCGAGMAAHAPVRRTVGTLFYVAPEILTEGYADQASDMWRYGQEGCTVDTGA